MNRSEVQYLSGQAGDQITSKYLVMGDSWDDSDSPEDLLLKPNSIEIEPNLPWNVSLDDEGGGTQEAPTFAGRLDYLTPRPHNLTSYDVVANDTSFNVYNDSRSLPIDMRFNDGHILLISCYSCLFFISLIGNLCVLRAILGGGRKHRKSRVNLMLLHLAIADLIVTTVMMPVEVGWAAMVQWLAGDALCRVFSFFRIFGHYLSSFILVCISIDRYFAVVHPLSMSAADKRGKIMLIFAWLLAFSCSMPQVIIFHVETHPQFTFYVQCVTFNFFPSEHHEIVYNIFCLVMLYVAPLSIIIFFYGAIVVTIFQKSRLSSDDSTIRRSSLGYLGRARARTIKMTVSIVLAFFICWTPYVVISLWFCFHRSAAALLDEKVKKGLFIFACFNSCVNPIVYGIFNFCKKKQPMQTQTWRSTTLNTQINSRSCECRSFKSSRVYWSRREPGSTVTSSEAPTAELLLPRALNSPYRTRSASGSDSAISLPMQTLPTASPLSRRQVAVGGGPSLIMQYKNGSYFSSRSVKEERNGNPV
uniref:Red pigment concentrating hormone receptor n=1 Tax=Carcinus maenas TaxID=6759 RepID=A0A2L0WQF2_CARMA|nr:red pigment concentrating hormone receptor [Carcinus maenas]